MSAVTGMLTLEQGRSMNIHPLGLSLLEALPVVQADAVHTWHEPGIFMGCKAQWITPEAQQEQVPFHDAERGLTITADVILDNRGELLERLGIPKAEHARIGDAQLILLAYAKWGEACPHYLLGDYAFMIWDERRQSLFGARDLCGNRTLYYSMTEEVFCFSTVIAPLFQVPGIGKQLEIKWLAEYLAIVGLHECSDASLTPYRGIYLLPPAHAITISRDGRIRLNRCGSILPEEPLHLASDEAYEEAFREVVGQAVAARLRTHRGAAATLSGGLDSGTVVSFAAKLLQKQQKTLHTYSYVPAPGFTDWTPPRLTGDERPYIEKVVRHVGNIEAHYLDLPDRTPLSDVDETLDLLEAPFKYFGGIYWIKGIYEAASSRGAGVLLTGGRGNFTISWGPALDYYALLLRRFQWFKLYYELTSYGRRMQVSRRKLLSLVRRKAYPAGRPASQDFAMPMMIHPELAKQTGVLERRLDEQLDLLTGSSFEDRKFKFDNLAIANKSGIAATKLSLHYGLWERDPTFDPRVVKFCLSVPIEQYVQSGMDRALVRRAMAGYLPDEVRLNQRVRGVQAADWVYRLLPDWPKTLAELQRMCEDSIVQGILAVEAIREAILEVGMSPIPEHAFHPKMQYLMRCLIVYRFLKKHVGQTV